MPKNHQKIRPIYIALGANLSNKKATFTEALQSLQDSEVKIEKVSGLWQSPSWPPGQGHPDYLNAVAAVDFRGDAEHLLALIQNVETKFGRVRSIRNAPRPLDLDILDFRGEIYESKKLTLPHPRMLSRGFVLFPLEQIAPDWADPHSGEVIGQFIAKLPYCDVAPMKYVGSFWEGTQDINPPFTSI